MLREQAIALKGLDWAKENLPLAAVGFEGCESSSEDADNRGPLIEALRKYAMFSTLGLANARAYIDKRGAITFQDYVDLFGMKLPHKKRHEMVINITIHRQCFRRVLPGGTLSDPNGPDVQIIVAAMVNPKVKANHYEPILKVFKEDIGEILARDLKRVAGYIFAALPVSGSDTGDYLVRNLTGIDPEQGLVAISEYVNSGDAIMFCRRDHKSAVEDMRRMLGDLRKRAGNATIRGGLYFSCCARGPNQFGDNSEEVGLISDELGEFPLVGFFANGEISNNRLYGYTGVLTLFL